MFERCRELLEEYVAASSRCGLAKRGEHLLQEARARLRQIQWIYGRLVRLNNDLEKDGQQCEPGQGGTMISKFVFHEGLFEKSRGTAMANIEFQKIDELRILLESFYYSSHRVVDLLSDHRNDLPSMPNIRPRGVCEVRNHLLEHPGKQSGVLVYSTACGGPLGPQIKPLRWSLDSPGTQDKGLYHNAREFEQALELSLSRAISSLLLETKKQ